MKKIIIGIVVLLIIAGVSAPYFNGMAMEKIIRNTQQDMNTMYADKGSDVTVEITRYDRGFSSSDIEWKINLGSLAALYGIHEIQLVDHAKHGLLGVVSETSLEQNKWYADVVNNKLDGKNPLHITTHYKLNGAIESIIKLEPFSVQESGETIDFRPAKIVAQIDDGLSHIQTKANWEGLTAGDKAEIGKIAIMSDLSKITTYVWDGEIEYSADAIHADNAQEQFELKDFKGNYGLAYDKKTNSLSIAGNFTVDKLDAGKTNLNDSSVSFAVNNLDARGYEEFMEMYTQSMYSILNDLSVPRDDPDELDQAMQNRMASASLQMMTAYEKLLKKGLEIKIMDLQAQVPDGNINGDLELILNKDISFAQLAATATQPAMVFELISLKSYLSLPKKMAGNNPNLVIPIYPGMQTGLFMVDGKNLVHKSETKEGKLFLNDYEVILN